MGMPRVIARAAGTKGHFMAGASAFRAAIVTVTAFQQNCTLLFDDQTKRAVVVDPGGDIPLIQKAIGEFGLKVEKILLTHGHIDHAGGVEELKETLANPDLQVEGPHVDDKFLLDGLTQQGQEFGLAGARNCRSDRFLDEGQKVDIAGHEFSILHCPGHSPGSLVFVNRAYNFTIMGDVLFQGSIGRTDFPYGNHDALILAIKTKILPLGDEMAFICGHGPGSTVGVERRTNPFLQG